MKRTQLYLDEDLWNILHVSAERSGTSVSELVREAVRERYLGKLDARAKAMRAVIGIRSELDRDSTAEVRSLRKGSRLERLATS